MLKALQRGALPTRLTSSMWHRMALRGGARQPYNRRRARGRRPHSRVQRGRVPGVHGCPRHRIRPARRAHRVRGGCGRWPGRPPPSLPTTSPCSTATRSAWTFRGACSGHPCRSSSVPLKLLATLFRYYIFFFLNSRMYRAYSRVGEFGNLVLRHSVSIKALSLPFFTEFWRHCVLSG